MFHATVRRSQCQLPSRNRQLRKKMAQRRSEQSRRQERMETKRRESEVKLEVESSRED
jgi:hypothetical protein